MGTEAWVLAVGAYSSETAIASFSTKAGALNQLPADAVWEDIEKFRKADPMDPKIDCVCFYRLPGKAYGEYYSVYRVAHDVPVPESILANPWGQEGWWEDRSAHARPRE